MNLWIVFMFSTTLVQSFGSDDSFTDREKGKLIKKELDALKKQKDLRLYTARLDDYTGTCTQPIFDCYCEELKVVMEEIRMSGEEDVAKTMRNTLDNMVTYRPSESDMTGSCKKCEEYEEKSFQEFMETFESIAQKINAN